MPLRTAATSQSTKSELPRKLCQSARGRASIRPVQNDTRRNSRATLDRESLLGEIMHRSKYSLAVSVAFCAMIPAWPAAFAQTPAAEPPEELVAIPVTGWRIIREGSQTPTPLPILNTHHLPPRPPLN